MEDVRAIPIKMVVCDRKGKLAIAHDTRSAKTRAGNAERPAPPSHQCERGSALTGTILSLFATIDPLSHTKPSL